MAMLIFNSSKTQQVLENSALRSDKQKIHSEHHPIFPHLVKSDLGTQSTSSTLVKIWHPRQRLSKSASNSLILLILAFLLKIWVIMLVITTSSIRMLQRCFIFFRITQQQE